MKCDESLYDLTSVVNRVGRVQSNLGLNGNKFREDAVG